MLPWPAVDASDHAAWSLIGRLGEAQLLLPAALAFAWWLARRSEARPLVQWWLSLMALAALVTTITKVAFIGWGVGNAAFDFTGVSGHAMFAAAVYPLLCAGVAASRARPWRRATRCTALTSCSGCRREALCHAQRRQPQTDRGMPRFSIHADGMRADTLGAQHARREKHHAKRASEAVSRSRPGWHRPRREHRL